MNVHPTDWIRLWVWITILLALLLFWAGFGTLIVQFIQYVLYVL